MAPRTTPPLIGLALLALAASGVGWAASLETGPAISPPPAPNWTPPEPTRSAARPLQR